MVRFILTAILKPISHDVLQTRTARLAREGGGKYRQRVLSHLSFPQAVHREAPYCRPWGTAQQKGVLRCVALRMPVPICLCAFCVILILTIMRVRGMYRLQLSYLFKKHCESDPLFPLFHMGDFRVRRSGAAKRDTSHVHIQPDNFFLVIIDRYAK